MRRAGVLVLAIAMIFAGCPADGDGQATVTPAAVPEMPTATPTAAPPAPVALDCSVPQPPAPPASKPRPPAEPASIPVENGVVNASALVDRHEATLANHRYRLGTPLQSASVTENRTAFLATMRTGGAVTAHYGVDGTRYTYYFEDGGRQRYGVSDYEPGRSMTVYGGSLSLTGGPTIERVLSTFPHRVATVRDDGWTVLRATVDEPTAVADAEVASLRSRILVDRRGIVRYVDTSVVADEGDDTLPVSGNTTLWISNIGDARFDRPDWVCRAIERAGNTDGDGGFGDAAAGTAAPDENETGPDSGTDGETAVNEETP